MSVLKQRFHLGIFLSESLGYLFWLVFVDGLYLSVKRDNLLFLQQVKSVDYYNDLFGPK